MKKNKILYWIFTGLICALMIFSALGSFFDPQSATVFYASLGLPAYIVPFLSWAKILGVIGILVPGYPRIKEWAYAGLAFDLIGAFYCAMMSHPDLGGAIFILVAIGMLFASYFFHHRLVGGTSHAASAQPAV